jgi:hypothetical protein
MADKQIVTKKTAVKPAATSAATPATPPIAKKTVTKKAVEQTANPTPSSPAPKPSKPAVTRSAAPKVSAATSNVAAETGGTKKAKATKPKPQTSREEKPMSLQDLANVTPEQRLDMIREAAYYKAEKRAFAEGHEADDWSEAEGEIDDLLAKARKIYGG